ncbi:MAG TPA: siphovirus ReqiPepy6 Gp37-like family protein [Candidatus Mediterraneibacter caccavium]|uniref:Siphovirus ReqiPepy6 Gp37-like family protein n=1 Tax=Candidatus Mediterraneibacter caccavium TaxID=2838661 RepID=A0A9D1VYB1_9FIRM|nr:siphovirus ReqiPepy6 Gp37-like family protein [Candidatus Mediterraneibacter caccavium]
MEDTKQLILADQNLKDIAPVMNAEIDIAIGEENDYEVKIPRDEWRPEYTFGNAFYIKDTEYGGIIGEVDTSTAEDTISLLGRTWRGMLDKKIIRTPAGQDYRKVSGELNTVLGDLITEQFDDYFVVSQDDTGVSLTNYQFDRYCTLLTGVTKMLQSVGCRLRITYRQQERGQPGYVELSAVPVVDYSEQIELSQDSQLNFTFKSCRNGVNHLICLGKGELQERQVIDLYVQEDGSIGKEPYYTGIREIAATYEDTSSETDELEEKGREKLLELMNSTSFEMDVESLGMDVEVGDIIGGRDYLTGMYAKKPIVKKIYRVEDGKASLKYGIKGDD